MAGRLVCHMNPAEAPTVSPPPTATAPRDLYSLLRGRLRDLKAYAHQQPVQAVATAFGVGLLVNLLPTRVVAGTVSTIGAAVLRPVLISLGITKAIELTCHVTPLTPKP